jgi:hypothetical protein
MKHFSLIIVVLFIASCSSSKVSFYKLDYPLSSQIAFSKLSNLSVKIPENWFSAEDNEFKCIDLWLIKNDYTASLNFMKINFDDETLKEIEQEGITRVTDFSKVFVKAKLGKSFKSFFNDETFEINGKSFAAYQYVNSDGISVRTIVFEHKTRYYELTAISKENGNFEELFRVQNSVLTTLN